MSKDFQDFQNYYLDNVVPKLRNELESSFTRSVSIEDIVGIVTGNCLGADISALSHYHKWLIDNFDIKPKN